MTNLAINVLNGPLRAITVSSMAVCAVGANAKASDASLETTAKRGATAGHEYFALQTELVSGSYIVRSISANDAFVDYRAAIAIGSRGVERLKNFSMLPHGWDGGSGEPLQKASLDRLSDFFALTAFRAPQMSVFMSSEGNAIINWQRQDGLVEIEFGPTTLSYFIEGTGEEGTLGMSAAALWEVRSKL